MPWWWEKKGTRATTTTTNTQSPKLLCVLFQYTRRSLPNYLHTQAYRMEEGASWQPKQSPGRRRLQHLRRDGCIIVITAKIYPCRRSLQHSGWQNSPKFHKERRDFSPLEEEWVCSKHVPLLLACLLLQNPSFLSLRRRRRRRRRKNPATNNQQRR